MKSILSFSFYLTSCVMAESISIICTDSKAPKLVNLEVFAYLDPARAGVMEVSYFEEKERKMLYFVVKEFKKSQVNAKTSIITSSINEPEHCGINKSLPCGIIFNFALNKDNEGKAKFSLFNLKNRLLLTKNYIFQDVVLFCKTVN
jgi:hypothetical protein